ncbi:MAG: hypothetical protein ACRD4Q_01140 [Candidatus Acidiferrales bacterium]
MRKIAALFLLCFAARGIAQTDIVSTGPGPYYTLAQGEAWGSKGKGGTDNAYIIYPKNPSDNVCFSFRNNNPTSAHNFNVSMYVTSQADVDSFYTTSLSASSKYWNQGPIFSTAEVANAYGQVMVMIPAQGAAAVALLLSGSSAQPGTPDTADVFAVSTSASSCGGQFSTTTVAPTLLGTSVGASITPFPRTNGEVPVTRSPYDWSSTKTITTSFQGLFFDGDPGQFSSCKFEFAVSLTGTSPTLNIYLQEALPDGTKSDVIAFNQFTGSGGTQLASISSSGSLAPYAPSFATLAAGTVRNGLMMGALYIDYVLGGTSPSATVNAYGECQ